MSFETLIESQIQEAIARGELSGLPGEGSPQRLDPLDKLAGTDWLGFHVLRDGEMLPEWLELAKDIERDEGLLDDISGMFIRLAELSKDVESWNENVPRLRLLVQEYAGLGHRLRAKQDQFNVTAPGMATQRPGIWVEQKISQLTDAMRERGAPDWAVARCCA